MIDSIRHLLAMRAPVKAKEIAKELGLSQREVNAYLHANRDQYRQDAAFCWSLVSAGELGLTLPDQWVTAEQFESILVGAGPVLDGPHEHIKVFVPANCRLMIDCTARLLSLMNQLAACGKAITLDFTVSSNTKNYLDRAGFFDHLDPDVCVTPNRPARSAAVHYQGQSETLVEFGSVDPNSDNEELIKNLTEKFVQQSSEAYRIAAFTVFSELIGNVKEHSNSVLRGIAGLQRYGGGRRHIQTVISDSGVGIAETLRPALQANYPNLHRKYGEKSVKSDIGLLIAAMSEGNISRYGGARGLGFKSSRQQAVKFHANFSVRQEEFAVRFDYRNGVLVQTTAQTQLARIRGTHICFDFFID